MQTSLPLWMQITALVGGVIGSIWPLYQLINAVLGARLTFKLTRDFFFRFTEYGECLFIRPVLIAEGGNILIREINAKLKRSDGSSRKEWELEVLESGEVIRQNNLIRSNFFFHSSSALSFLQTGVPLRAVYMVRPKCYGSEYVDILNNLTSDLVPLKIIAAEPVNKNPMADKNISQKVQDLVSGCSTKLIEKIQLETGKYEIEITFKYSRVSGIGRWFPRTSSTGRISFTIDSTARDQIKATLPRAIQVSAENFVFRKDEIIPYPEYNAKNIEEL